MSMEATEYAFPFDAEECEGGYDREYIADDFARYFRAFITSGIIADGGNIAESLQVVTNDDMTTTLKKGNLMIDGYRYELMEDMIFHHTAADGVLDRIDRISITLDTAEREIHAIVREGEYSYKPVAPQCRRNSEHLDYVVADVRVVAGAIKIVQANIKDTRLSTELCGIAFPFWKLDTQAFFVQLNSFYNEFVAKSDQSYAQFQDWQDDKKAEINTWQAAEEKQTDDWQKKKTDDFTVWAEDFTRTWEGWMSGKVSDWSDEILEWFNNLREQLTDNAEVHLQEQIGNLENLKTNEKSSLVVAINNLYTMLQDAISKAVKKAGDIMTGNLTLLSEKLEERKLQLEVNGRKGWFCISNNKRLGIYDGNNSKWLVMAEPDGTTVLNGRAESATTATTATAAGKLSTARSINGLLFDGTGDRMNYAVCDGLVRDGDDYVINAACPGFKLAVGAEIRVLMKTARISGYNSRTKLLLNVNNTGRLEIKDKSYRDVDEGVIYTFMYDGSQWIMRGIDNELECYDKAFLSGADSAVSIYIPLKFNGSYLLVGRGYADTEKSMGTDDYFKASLLINKASGDDADWYNVWQEITLGTSGSTARFSTVKEKDVDGITFKVPKGSAASIYIYKLET